MLGLEYHGIRGRFLIAGRLLLGFCSGELPSKSLVF